MRHFKNMLMLFMTLSVLTLTSCSEDDANDILGNIPGAAAGTITAKVDGSTFTSLTITTFASKVDAGGQTTLQIQGNTQDQSITIIINGYQGPDTYEISDASPFISAIYTEPNISDPQNSPIWSAPFQDSGVIGELIITEDTDTNVQGTFSFTGKNNNDNSTKAITEGSFNVNYM